MGVLILFEGCPLTWRSGRVLGRVDDVVWSTGWTGRQRIQVAVEPEPVGLLRGERTPTPGRPEPLMGPGRPGVRYAWVSARVVLDDHLDVTGHGDLVTLGAAHQRGRELLEVHVEVVRDGRQHIAQLRSEERRVGKECRSRWSPYH